MATGTSIMSLVRRGGLILDFGVIDKWNNELEHMHSGKEVPYTDTKTFAQLLGDTRVYFHLRYRDR